MKFSTYLRSFQISARDARHLQDYRKEYSLFSVRVPKSGLSYQTPLCVEFSKVLSKLRLKGEQGLVRYPLNNIFEKMDYANKIKKKNSRFVTKSLNKSWSNSQWDKLCLELIKLAREESILNCELALYRAFCYLDLYSVDKKERTKINSFIKKYCKELKDTFIRESYGFGIIKNFFKISAIFNLNIKFLTNEQIKAYKEYFMELLLEKGVGKASLKLVKQIPVKKQKNPTKRKAGARRVVKTIRSTMRFRRRSGSVNSRKRA